MDSERDIKRIDIDNIIPNRFQPRLTFDPTALNELSESIKQYGIFQPLVVRKVGTKYEIIAGERRYKASSNLGLKEVPCIVVELDDNESAEVALVENIQRKDLTPIEEARSYKKLLDRGYINQDQLAKRMGKSQSTIANKIRLLKLNEEVQNALLENKISERHARSLLALNEKEEQQKMLDRIIEEKLTVRKTDKEIEKLTNKEEKKPDFIPIESEVIKPEEETIKNIIKKKDTDEKPNIVDLLKKDEEKEIPEIKIEKDEKPDLNLNPKDLINKINIEENEPNFIDENIEEIKPIHLENLISEEEDIPEIKEHSNSSKYVTNNIKTAINTVRECVNKLEKYGFVVEKDEEDLEKNYNISIKIKKTE